ncbi:MAG: RNA polymerase sigma factor [Candidatus Eisenbacteria bacterium]
MMKDDEPDALDESLVLTFQRDPDGAPGRRAATMLLARWQGRAFGWAYRFAGEREQALDLAQECLMKVYRALPDYQFRGKFSAWVFTIVHNTCRDYARGRRRFERDDVDLDTLVSPVRGPEELLESGDQQRRISALMFSALDPHERMALWMRAHDEMGVDEITRVLGLAGASGARGVLQSARRKLRAALADAEQGPRP